MSGGICPGGNCPGGNCPDTVTRTNVKTQNWKAKLKIPLKFNFGLGIDYRATMKNCVAVIKQLPIFF